MTLNAGGGTAHIHLATGPMAGMALADMTVGILHRPTNGYGTLWKGYDAGLTSYRGLLWYATGLFCVNDPSGGNQGLQPLNTWAWLVMTKAAGSSTIRYHVGTLAGSVIAWAHVDATAGPQPNGPALTQWYIGENAAVPAAYPAWNGDFASWAGFQGLAMSDAQVEAAFTTALADLHAADPDVLVIASEDVAADPLTNRMDSSVLELDRTPGWTVTADPAGFNLSLAPPSDPPTAYAGSDRAAYVGSPTNVDGSGSTPAAGRTIASYAWAFTVRPAGSTAALSGAGAVQTFTPDAPGVYTLRLTVTDDLGATAQDTITITAQDAPTSFLLDAGDLAYMRATQTDTRPTEATLVPRNETPDGMGGTSYEDGDPQPVNIRVARLEEVPAPLAARYGVGVQMITMDLVTVTAGDAIRVSPTEAYEVVSDGAVTSWTTAQQVYAVRTLWPTGEA